MSKEMIHSKLKAKKLNYIIEDGTTYIIVKNSTPTQEQIEIKPEPTKALERQKTTVASILALYQKENQHLKDKIVQLENKIDKLVDDKEQMLRDERDKIEQVYSAKDEQLKNILELVNAKLKLEQPAQMIHDVESFDDEEKPKIKKKKAELIEFRTYLKTLKMKSYQKKIIRKRFLAAHDNDIRIIQQNGQLYLDFSKYDYSDLLAY